MGDSLYVTAGGRAMPWRKSWVVDEADERLKLIAAVIDGELSMRVACEAAGVSRKTGYKWLERYRNHGLVGLKARSRAPRRHGRRMAPELARLITALRRRRRFWGPRKLKTILERNHPQLVIPAASTIGDLLRRQGLSTP